MRLFALFAVGAALWNLLTTPTPPPVDPLWFRALPRGDRSTFFPPGAITLRKVGRGVETRNAFIAWPSRPLWHDVDVPVDGALELGMSVYCPEHPSCAGTATFSVHARLADGQETELLRRTVSGEAIPPGWERVRIDLAHLAGQRIGLRLDLSLEPASAPTGDLVALWAEPLLLGGGDRRFNVVLVSIDTLRADRLGSYGYTRPTSPHLDGLAADGVRFAQAISQSPWTTPSHMSMFTSLYPSTHRVNQDWPTFLAFRDRGQAYRALPDSMLTLPEQLHAAGYRTIGLTGGGTMSGVLGFARGFDVYREDARKLTPGVWAELDQWLTSVRSSPFFLFLHTFEVHAPYRHLDFTEGLMTEPQRADLQQLLDRGDWMALIADLESHLRSAGLYRAEITTALYDGGIRYTDAFLGRLLERLRQLDLYDRTVIVVTSDHGEEFGDHDPARIYDAHCQTLYEELIRVPLLIRAPGRFAPGTVVGEQVELIDVAPTILDLVGIDSSDTAMQGKTLTPLMDGAAAEKQWALSEATCIGHEWKSLRTPAFKYVATFAVADGERTGISGPMETEAVFDLHADPREQRPIETAPSQRLHAMRNQLHDQLTKLSASASETRGVEMNDDLRERLRALGYIK